MSLGDSLTYLFGPRFSFHQGDRWTFYADLLFGGAKLTQDRVFPERIPTGDLTEWNKLDAWVQHGLIAESTEANGFAMAIGGGVDSESETRNSHTARKRAICEDHS